MPAFDPPEYGVFDAVAVGYDANDHGRRHLELFRRRGGDHGAVDRVDDVRMVFVDDEEVPPGRAESFGHDDNWDYRVCLEEGDALARIERIDPHSGGGVSGVSL